MSTTRKRITPVAVCAMLRALICAPHTLTGLAAVAGVSKPLVSTWLVALRASVPLIYIAVWTPNTRGSLTVPAYAWGCQPDAPRPAPKPPKQRMAESRARKGMSK